MCWSMKSARRFCSSRVLSLSSRIILCASVLPDFSVQPSCSLCLCGYSNARYNNHRDTENTKVAQRRVHIRSLSKGAKFRCREVGHGIELKQLQSLVSQSQGRV